LPFGWEVKAKQKGFEDLRLEKDNGSASIDNDTDYAAQAGRHISAITYGRTTL